jgi:DNA repair protein RadC
MEVLTINKSNKGHRERLRERFLSYDMEHFTDGEMLELILTYAIPRRDVKPLAMELIGRFGSLDGVLSASIDDLCEIQGVKKFSAILIKLVDRVSLSRKEFGKSTRSNKQDTKGQLTLFNEGNTPKHNAFESEPKLHQKILESKEKHQKKAKLFSITALSETIALIPKIPDTDNIEQIKAFLRQNLHFNSVRTRRDYAAYIVKRMFPGEYADKPLRQFASYYDDGTQGLRDICFYRFANSEPLMLDIILDALIPAMTAGKLSRDYIIAYLVERFGHENKNIPYCVSAVINVLTSAQIASLDRKIIRIAYRDIALPAFAFILHSEFPEPGMYDIQKIENNRSIRAMFWNPNNILTSLYELRNIGIINKVSEIDSVRQFTIKYDLQQVVEKLIAGEYKN